MFAPLWTLFGLITLGLIVINMASSLFKRLGKTEDERKQDARIREEKELTEQVRTAYVRRAYTPPYPSYTPSPQPVEDIYEISEIKPRIESRQDGDRRAIEGPSKGA